MRTKGKKKILASKCEKQRMRHDVDCKYHFQNRYIECCRYTAKTRPNPFRPPAETGGEIEKSRVDDFCCCGRNWLEICFSHVLSFPWLLTTYEYAMPICQICAARRSVFTFSRRRTLVISRFGSFHPVSDNLLMFFLTIYLPRIYHSLGHAAGEDAKNTRSDYCQPITTERTFRENLSAARNIRAAFRPIDSICIHIGFQSVVDHVSGGEGRNTFGTWIEDTINILELRFRCSKCFRLPASSIVYIIEFFFLHLSIYTTIGYPRYAPQWIIYVITFFVAHAGWKGRFFPPISLLFVHLLLSFHPLCLPFAYTITSSFTAWPAFHFTPFPGTHLSCRLDICVRQTHIHVRAKKKWQLR